MRRWLSALMLAVVIVCGVLGGFAVQVVHQLNILEADGFRIDGESFRTIGTRVLGENPVTGDSPTLFSGKFIGYSDSQSYSKIIDPPSLGGYVFSGGLNSVILRSHAGWEDSAAFHKRDNIHLVQSLFRQISGKRTYAPEIRSRLNSDSRSNNHICRWRAPSIVNSRFEINFDGTIVYDHIRCATNLNFQPGAISIMRGIGGAFGLTERGENEPNTNPAEKDAYGCCNPHDPGPPSHYPLGLQILTGIVGLIIGAWLQTTLWRKSDPGSLRGWVYGFGGIVGGALGCAPAIFWLW